ncbi:uncharacterized protein LOC106181948, partial [Lingula anatina]|uniref:Uncharacterized protein LOC106181948 n=1 Tax=Lingula anatina TaxID=7574 RepID=A0A2R2MSC1_LINAN
TFSPPDGAVSNTTVSVFNAQRTKTPTGEAHTIRGFAYTTEEPGKLAVKLDGVPVKAPYWIIKLGPQTFSTNGQYEYAVVTDNFRVTLFVLARDPEGFKLKYDQEVKQFVKDAGFTEWLNEPLETYQGNDCLYAQPPQ